MKLKLMFFQEKKDLVGVNGPFWTQKYSASLKTQVHSKYILKFCILKGAKKHMKIMF